MKALIIDDEPKNIRILRNLLKEFCPNVEIVGEATSAEEAIPEIDRSRPDLVFLDIEMPRGNAFDLLDKVKPISFEIIFITAFDEYSLKAFQYSALHYLLKPVNIEELKQAVDRAAQKVDLKILNSKIENLQVNFGQLQIEKQKIALPGKDGSTVFFEVGQILRLEAKGGYTLIFVTQNSFYISAISLTKYEELLPKAIFFRVHKSAIVNLTKTKKYHKGRGGHIEMEDGSLVEVASRRKEEFIRQLRSK